LFFIPLGPRHLHKSVLHERKLYIFGGKDDKGNILFDMWVLCLGKFNCRFLQILDTFTWKELVSSLVQMSLKNPNYQIMGDQLFIFQEETCLIYSLSAIFTLILVLKYFKMKICGRLLS